MVWELGIQTDTLIGNPVQVTSFGICPTLLHPWPDGVQGGALDPGSPCAEDLQETCLNMQLGRPHKRSLFPGTGQAQYPGGSGDSSTPLNQQAQSPAENPPTHTSCHWVLPREAGIHSDGRTQNTVLRPRPPPKEEAATPKALSIPQPQAGPTQNCPPKGGPTPGERPL